MLRRRVPSSRAARIACAGGLAALAGLGGTVLARGEIPLAGAWLSSECAVNASGGYANCLEYGGPNYELAQARHTAGLAYRFQLHRPSDGASWGWWEWSDLGNHVLSLHLGGVIRAQVDNRGSANPAVYYVEMG